jgi:predicted anti-sigma-YlaC factor YlaD
MRYVIALFCPPLAMARARRPFQALAATVILVLAAALWPAVGALGLIGLTMLWACNVTGDQYAAEELEAFTAEMRRMRPRRFGWPWQIREEP